MFVTNPLGAKLEQQVTAEGEGGFGETVRTSTSTGMASGTSPRTARSTLGRRNRHPDGDAALSKDDRPVWGVNFMRNIRRKNEQVFWAPIH